MKILVGYLTDDYLVHDRTRFDVRYAPLNRAQTGYPLSIAEMRETSCPPGWKPDVFLHPGLGHFPLPTDIEEFEGLAVCAVGDWDRRGRATRAGLGFFDLPMGQRNLLPILKNEGYANAEFTRLWYAEPEKHRVIPGIERDIDLLFVGSINPLIWGTREKWLERIGQFSDRYTVRIENGVFEEEYVRLLNRAKIVFNCSVDGATNARAYEAAACGALVFNEAGNAENAEIFTDGVHHVTYTPENFDERLAYYLVPEHSAEREKIAEAGRTLVVTEHTMRSHTDAMFETIELHLTERYRPSAALPKWERLYRKAQQVYGCASPPAIPYCRQLLQEANRAGVPSGLFHEGQAALFAWEATESASEPLGLVEAASEQATRALTAFPQNLFMRMTFAEIQFLRFKATGVALPELERAKTLVSETLEFCASLLSGEVEFDFTLIEGFGFPRLLDGFDFRVGRAEMRLNAEPEQSVGEIIANFGWRCGKMRFDHARVEGNLREAKEAGFAALRFLENTPSFRLQVADCLADLGEWAEAAQFYRAIDEVPFSLDHWQPVLTAYRNAGLEQEANAFLQSRLHLIDAMPGLKEMKLS